MRIKVLSRDEKQYTRERPNDLQRVHRNAAPELHPFERAREYKRALNAVKMERAFAKPFLGALNGHSDGVYCLQRHHSRLNLLLSGACDGGAQCSLATLSPRASPSSNALSKSNLWLFAQFCSIICRRDSTVERGDLVRLLLLIFPQGLELCCFEISRGSSIGLTGN